MLIRAYGLFWRADEVDWTPGKGNKNAFRLLGRIGAHLPSLQVADFREQRGIYILYGNHGPHYVGLTRSQDLGKRVRDHLFDQHAGKWNRFSWFGFRAVLKSKDPFGCRRLKDLASMGVGDPADLIGDMEALLIRAMGLSANKAQMNFCNACEWTQVKIDEVTRYLGELSV